MKILFSSYTFSPNIGGIESVSAILAEKFVEAGYRVELITQTPGEEDRGAKYRVTRRPSIWKVLRLLLWSDVLFQNNISLGSLFPAWLLRKRIIVIHQTWLRGVDGEVGWNNRIKRALLPHVENVAISQAIGDDIQVPARVIGNPYDDRVYRLLPAAVRDRALVFLGRLVSDKGGDLLLRAMKILKDDGLTPDLTIIGGGPEGEKLQQLSRELGLDRQVTFTGQKSGRELAELLNRHQILAVPSRWPEPFGIVALEGIACGCVVVGSQDGGLKEAIGPCGLTFENGNERALSECLRTLLRYPETLNKFRQDAPMHLNRFRAETIATVYCRLLEDASS
ncbi:MAG: glycosyltransferase family 4 protein [Verrucomicrobiota bacterium]